MTPRRKEGPCHHGGGRVRDTTAEGGPAELDVPEERTEARGLPPRQEQPPPPVRDPVHTYVGDVSTTGHPQLHPEESLREGPL